MILHVVGNRPQFIKLAPVVAAMDRLGIEQMVAHTGQHYDRNMSEVFFHDLGLAPPSLQLHVGSGTHAEQTARALMEIERILLTHRPDAVLVYGDTNSTLAAGLAAAKLAIPVGHVEAGPRTYDRDEPEEINRVAVDHLSTWNFCPDDVSVANLQREGITRGVRNVGDVMLDAFRLFRPEAERRSEVLAQRSLPRGRFALVTFHRPCNTDDAAAAAAIVELISRLPMTVALPLHPRTTAALRRHGLLRALEAASHVRVMPAVGYLDMIVLLTAARVVLTDSGGLQKEASFAGKGVIVLGEHTPWTHLAQAGWLKCAYGADSRLDPAQAAEWAGSFGPTGTPPQVFGDGHASDRIAEVLAAVERGPANDANPAGETVAAAVA